MISRDVNGSWTRPELVNPDPFFADLDIKILDLSDLGRVWIYLKLTDTGFKQYPDP